MSHTKTKIRYGLILQGAFSEALRLGKVRFVETPEYRSGHEVPDYLIPDATAPQKMIEVHQTETRDHFRMKTLRAITAVSEAKVHFGNRLVTLNVLFGDPTNEIPENNVNAMCSLFDGNLLIRKAVDAKKAAGLEEEASRLAEEYSKTTAVAIRELVQKHAKTLQALGPVLKEFIGKSKVQSRLSELWDLERVRRSRLGSPPRAGGATYYKRSMLAALFLSDADFAVLLKGRDASALDADGQRHLIAVGLADLHEEVDGDQLVLDSDFASFLRDPRASELRAICKEVLDASPQMRLFFEDIRDRERRRRMCKAFLKVVRQGEKSFRAAFKESLEHGNYAGIEHARCWIADLMPLAMGQSHNFFNGKVYRHPKYTLSLGNPYPNIVIRSPRLGRPADRQVFAEVTCTVLWQHATTAGIDFDAITEDELAEKLLKFRVQSAIKLKKLDPLVLVVAGLAAEYGLECKPVAVQSLVSDMTGDNQTGVYRLWEICDPQSNRRVHLNALAANENPQDKAKEWGARRLASKYRLIDGAVAESDVPPGLFVLDGIWDDDDAARLYRCGWDHICRLGDLEPTMKKIFGLKAKRKSTKASVAVLSIEDGDEEA